MDRPPSIARKLLQRLTRLQGPWIGVAMIVIVLISYARGCQTLQMLELKAFDLRLSLAQKPVLSPQVAIIDIDEASLKRYGRWPWPRELLAELIDRVIDARGRVLAFDMVFSEKLSSSSAAAQELIEYYKFNRQALALSLRDRGGQAAELDRKLQAFTMQEDGNRVFSAALEKLLPIVLGLIFTQDADPAVGESLLPQIQAAELCAEEPAARRALREFTGVTPNLAELTPTHVALGHFNFLPDADGVSRRSLLTLRYKNHAYGSLGLAAVAQATGEKPQCTISSTGRLEALELAGISIPVTSRGEMLLRYYGGARAFPYVSFADILDRKPAALSQLQGRILLVGTSAPGLFDLRITPLSRGLPGVEIHATAIQNMLEHSFLTRPPNATLVELVIMCLVGLLLVAALPRISALQGALLVVLLAGAILLGDYFLAFRRGVWLYTVHPLFEIALIYTALTLTNYLREERRARAERLKRKELKAAFQQYVSASVVDQIISEPERLKLGGERRELTVLFSDVRGFTSLSERLTPEALVDLLNDYLTPMTDIVLARQGMLDKYMGDAIMAVFGAPIAFAGHAASACRAAIDMRRRLLELHERWKDQHLPLLEMGVGINTGDMSIGNMGSQQRFDYTVMGDHVNLGSRLEGVNKIFGTTIIVSEYTRRQAGDQFVFRELDQIQVKGKTKAIAIFELMNEASEAPTVELGVVEQYALALTAYRRQDFAAAKSLFEALLAFHPSDTPTQTMLQRIGYLERKPPNPNWNGVFQMRDK